MVWRMMNYHIHPNVSLADSFVLAINNSPIGNDTIDVMVKGCFDNFSAIACVRNGVMSMLVLLTAALCVVKICRLHINGHPTLHQYVIFYCATVECLMCTVHWIMSLYAQLDFMAQYLKLVQFLMVSHFYWTLATRALRKEKLTRRVIGPFYGVALLYFTVAVILACINVQPSWIECFQPYWLLLSAAEFSLVQLFMLAGFYITRRLNEISTLDSIRRAQKRDLWSLIVTFEISALVGLVYDVTLKSLGDDDDGCSGVFMHMQEIYTPVFGTFMIIKFLLPIWAMLFVFHPMEVASDRDEFLPAISEDGTYTSVFTPPYDTRARYKPLFQPGAEGTTPESDASTSPPSLSTTPVYGPVRRTSTNLAPITEEHCADAEHGDVEAAEREHMIAECDRKPILQ